MVDHPVVRSRPESKGPVRFDGRLQLLEYVPTVLDGPLASATHERHGRSGAALTDADCMLFTAVDVALASRPRLRPCSTRPTRSFRGGPLVESAPGIAISNEHPLSSVCRGSKTWVTSMTLARCDRRSAQEDVPERPNMPLSAPCSMRLRCPPTSKRSTSAAQAALRAGGCRRGPGSGQLMSVIASIEDWRQIGPLGGVSRPVVISVIVCMTRRVCPKHHRNSCVFVVGTRMPGPPNWAAAMISAVCENRGATCARRPSGRPHRHAPPRDRGGHGIALSVVGRAGDRQE